MAAQAARPTQAGIEADKPPNQAPAASLDPQEQTSEVSAKAPPRPDPSSTDVFQRGPDGKLHPAPGWRTTGPLDLDVWSHNIDWRGAGSDLTNMALGALTFMEGGALVGGIIAGLGYKIGPDVVSGIIHGHHTWPKFMGGPGRQDLARVYESLHRMFHDDLAAALKQAGFPRIGGRGGSAEDWAAFFAKDAGKRDEAIAVLQRVTRDFDRKNGTTISKYLDDTLTKGQTPGSPPPQ